jgi:hypothetical protein
MNNLEIEAKIKELTSQCFSASAIDYIGPWQIIPIVHKEFLFLSEIRKREITIDIAKRLVRMGLIPFNFERSEDGFLS